MSGWHHCINGYEFEQALGGTEGQESLACCGSCDHKLDMTGIYRNIKMFCKSRVIRSIVLSVYRGIKVNREEQIQKFQK